MQYVSTENYKQYSFKPLDFEHTESEEFLEIVVQNYRETNEQLSDLINEIYRKVFPKALDRRHFELDLVDKSEFYQAFDDYSPSVKNKIERILKNIDSPIWQKAYLLRFDDNDLQVDGTILTKTDILLISWYTTA